MRRHTRRRGCTPAPHSAPRRHFAAANRPEVGIQLQISRIPSFERLRRAKLKKNKRTSAVTIGVRQLRLCFGNIKSPAAALQMDFPRKLCSQKKKGKKKKKSRTTAVCDAIYRLPMLGAHAAVCGVVCGVVCGSAGCNPRFTIHRV